MVQYMGNVSQMNSISTTGRLRKLFAKELKQDVASFELDVVVGHLLKDLK